MMANKVILLLIAFVCSMNIMAQRNKKPTVKKPVQTVVLTTEEINYANLLPATAKIMFIDSLVVDEHEIIDNIHIASSCGVLYAERQDSLTNYSCTDEMQTVRYSSVANKEGEHQLFIQTRIGRSWTEPQPIILEGDFTDIICPYLMPDGVTLYFAARNGEDNVGEHDLFYTVFNNESRTFYRPQSLGLPYNSMEEDFYCIIDDITNLGYLVTKRRQEKGKACIYIFIPTESRMTYDAETTSLDALASYAALNSIEHTQYDKQAVNEAKARYYAICNKQNNTDADDIIFVVNENTTYHKLSDFKNETNRSRYEQWLNRKAELKQSENALEVLREEYHKGNTATSEQIVEIENYLQKERTELNKIEKQIRNVEIMSK